MDCCSAESQSKAAANARFYEPILIEGKPWPEKSAWPSNATNCVRPGGFAKTEEAVKGLYVCRRR
jgi:hypothetical protein